MNIGQIIGDGGLLVALPLALLAGLVSFASPCVLPLVPGYLAYVGGMAPQGGENPRRERSRLLLGVVLFVLGFTLVFVLMSIIAGAAGVFLVEWSGIITRVLGVVIIIMGVAFVGQVSFLQREWKPAWTPATGLVGAPLLGIVFAVGWVPCLGPTLTAILSLGYNSGTVGRAVILAIAYCIGLGLPFILVAFGFGWMAGATSFLKRHIRVINLAGGVLLVLIGILMVTGLWGALMSSLGSVIAGFDPAI
ncbi:cytochrome c biogenesis protein CcdA [Mycetocola tolaasinivorans]|uniref:Cytochrome c biogenesis protein CcdA n=1 Tax=Mycetocola tolaasinivorans TaxID=76635 RepID=A0A3L7A5R4_9MICO|nr:cytochrome c biogenesis protein CcdA [Mycetocola tolaasinivorans]RLP75666.1 cytochrome c biogenesis protein CcdA [Mycetocola tolaasinivorans]